MGSYAYDGGRLLAYGTGVPVLLGHDDRGNVITHGEQAVKTPSKSSQPPEPTPP